MESGVDTAPDTEAPESLEVEEASEQQVTDEGAGPGAPSDEQASSEEVAESAEGAADEPAETPAEPDVNFNLVLALWLSKPSLERLQEATRCEISDDPERASEADLIVISTRAPRARALPIIRNLRQSGKPIGIVCHTGGEQIGLEIMRAGGAGVVAEGNEEALRRLISEDRSGDESLVSTYEQRVGSARDAETTSSNMDRVTGLPGAMSFDARLSELGQSGSLARVGFASLSNFSETTAGLEPEGVDVLRRRIATLYGDITHRLGAELFVISPSVYAFLGRDMTARQAQDFGRDLARITEVFAPGGTLPMYVAVGHAGPELSSDLPLLRELSERALEAATKQEGSAVVNAEDLSNSLVSATELDMALRMVSYLSDYDGYPGSHSSRVADYASEIARQLGFEGRELIRVRLTALMHDIGKVGPPPEAMQESDDLEGFGLEAYHSHPERGSRYVRLTAGVEVSEAIHAHHENWDGTGFPQGLKGEEIPMTARIVAVANTFDILTTVPQGTTNVPLTRKEAIAKLREQSGSKFEPVMVEAAEVALSR